MMPHRLFVAFLLIIGIAIVGCQPEEDEPAEQEPEQEHRLESYFTQPQPNEPDESIEKVIIDLLNDVPSGSVVRAAFYTFRRESVAQAFIDAHDRGVDVHIVLGNTSTYPSGTLWEEVRSLRDHLGNRVTICRDGQSEGGCIGDNIQHNKFITFSRLGDGDRDVVLQTSSNMTWSQLNQFNNLVVSYNDAGLYEAFLDYWDDLRNRRLGTIYEGFEQGDFNSRVYFFPIVDEDPVQDPIFEALRSVNCEIGADVYIAMAFFTDGRRRVAERLRQMDNQGCGVNVILRERPQIGSPGNLVNSYLQSGDIDYGIFPDGDPVQLHSKYMAINGAYGPDGEVAQIVWTGSHNYTGAALHSNDEVLLKLRDVEIFEAFHADWEHIRSRAETVHP